MHVYRSSLSCGGCLLASIVMCAGQVGRTCTTGHCILLLLGHIVPACCMSYAALFVCCLVCGGRSCALVFYAVASHNCRRLCTVDAWLCAVEPLGHSRICGFVYCRVCALVLPADLLVATLSCHGSPYSILHFSCKRHETCSTVAVQKAWKAVSV